ncbi:17074_t:CDS:2 [Gigaspora margarita]|uniref:17074_t:CDS:1 n=1 Tax=Gigaspora margarita TaxID=4874 RepID=A0ABN7UM35_GIGMA|nr:17074_t:CDS:2 [Gigaspora margarita]
MCNQALSMNLLASYLQQPVNGTVQLPASNFAEDPINKLTTLMEELVMTLKNDNGSRGNQNCNHSNAPFQGNWSQTCNNENERVGVPEAEGTSSQNRPTVDVNRAQAMLAQLLFGEDAFNSEIHSLDPLFETFAAAKRRKKNDSEAEEVETPELNKEENKNHVHKVKKEENYKDNESRQTQVKGHPILLVLDSGSSECVVSANFLKEVGIGIDCPSTVVMIGVHGEQKQPLEEVDEFLVTVGRKTIASRAMVTDARNYGVIMGNNWIKKARARLDWKECELIIRDRRKKIKIPTEYCKPTNINKRIEKKGKSTKVKKELEEDESISEEEAESEIDESDLDKEYEEEEFQEDKEEFRWCKKCLKVEHEADVCVFFKGPEYETIYLNEEREKEDFNIGPIMVQEHFPERVGPIGEDFHSPTLIYTENGPPVKQKFYPTSRPEYEFIKTEI